jgi:RNA polymerase sigma-70 factor (ECF subfamily)
LSVGPEALSKDQSILLTTYVSERAALARFLVARLGNPDEAQDVMQELYLRISRIEGDRDVRDPLAYLFRVAFNLARDHRRERARAREREAKWGDANFVAVGSDVLSETPSAETGYGAKQLVAQVRSALNELSPQCQRVFRMHKFEGLKHEEVARRLGITRSTVEKHMHTALVHLVRRLERD